MSNTITPTVFYRTLNMEGLEIFYREAGPRDAPTVLLLHGFPSSSHMFRTPRDFAISENHVLSLFSEVNSLFTASGMEVSCRAAVSAS
jgi:pimeloyl-ACP methyl ester carboxylesterase